MPTPVRDSDVLAGGRTGDGWLARLRTLAGERRARVVMVTVLVAVLVLVGSRAATVQLRRASPVTDADVRVACRAVVAYRDAAGAEQYRVTRAELAAMVPALGTGTERRARGVQEYAAALLGEPADGSGQLLLAAARSCRRAGAPSLHRQVQPLLD